MKTKIFALFAAMMLLVGTTAMAQSGDTKTSKTTETEIKGDVNNDGVVDVADIAAVIAVMHEQGTVGTPYYWYAGWTEPTAENIGDCVKETYPSAKGSTTMNPAGKTSATLAGTVIDFSTNPIYDQEARNAGTPREYYFVLPIGYGIYNPTLQLFWQDDAAFEKVREFTNHKVLKFTEGAAYKIDSWIIKEIK